MENKQNITEINKILDRLEARIDSMSKRADDILKEMDKFSDKQTLPLTPVGKENNSRVRGIFFVAIVILFAFLLVGLMIRHQ
jgi:hypothetical protein